MRAIAAFSYQPFYDLTTVLGWLLSSLMVSINRMITNISRTFNALDSLAAPNQLRDAN